jgi:hypothetical protein
LNKTQKKKHLKERIAQIEEYTDTCRDLLRELELGMEDEINISTTLYNIRQSMVQCLQTARENV